MAGDWIKVENVTPDKPEINAMADDLGLHPDHILGALIRLWVRADEQTLDGNARSVTRSWIDRCAGIEKFSISLEKAGWLIVTERGLRFPHFNRHNGKSAKKRALTAKRVAGMRKRKCNAPNVTHALAREQRPEKSKTDIPLPPCLQTDAFRAAWLDWGRHLSERRKPLKPTTATRQLAFLEKLGHDGAIRSIEVSVRNGWVGLFEPKGDGQRMFPAVAPPPGKYDGISERL